MAQEIVQNFAKQHKNVRQLNFRGRLGKGGAIIEGFKIARGDLVGFVDADESTEVEEYLNLIRSLIELKADGVIGSRRVKGSVILSKQPLRGVTSWSLDTTLQVAGHDACLCQIDLQRIWKSFIPQNISLDILAIGGERVKIYSKLNEVITKGDILIYPITLVLIFIIAIFHTINSFNPGYIASWDGPAHLVRAEHFYNSLNSKALGIWGWYHGWYLGVQQSTAAQRVISMSLTAHHLESPGRVYPFLHGYGLILVSGDPL